MHRAGRLHSRIKLDFAKRALVVGDILVEDRGERFCLLRAEIDSLKVFYLHLIFGRLLHGAEDEKKIPDTDAHLHTVSVGFTIIRSIHQIKVRLCRSNHKPHSLTGSVGKENGDGQHEHAAHDRSRKEGDWCGLA